MVADIDALLARPDLFPHPEDPSKGAFVGCPAGWGCQLANAQLYKAFDMEAKGWLLVDPGSAAGLDGSMAKAAERGEPWFGYYWSPTALIGKYGMVPQDMGEWAGSDNWDNCIVKPEQECDTKSHLHGHIQLLAQLLLIHSRQRWRCYRLPIKARIPWSCHERHVGIHD